MVNIECQSKSFLIDNDPTRYLHRMNSSVNLYDDLTMKISIDSDEDEHQSITSPTNMTNSDSSDSAIVADAMDEREISSTYRNSWPKIMEKHLHPRFSFEILNQQKYKHPLPWLKSSPTKVFFSLSLSLLTNVSLSD